MSTRFFTVGSYDSREDVPAHLHWLFKPDCMDPIWVLLTDHLSIKRPSYRSEEQVIPEALYAGHPFVTPYRVLVCAIVTVGGMSKAMLGYWGYSTAVTWIEWASAVPLAIV